MSSGSRLAIGRSALRWCGPGETAFLGSIRRAGGPELPFSGPPRAVGWELAGPMRLAAGDDLDPGLGESAGADASLAAEAFLAAGGRECVLAHGAWVEGLAAGETGVEAARSALVALADRDNAGTIVLLGDSAAHARDLALEIAARRDDVFILVEARGGDSPSLGLLRENAAAARFPTGYTDAASDIGRFAASLEASDFSEDPPFRRREKAGEAALASRERAAIELWRRREGLRRSVDRGTRWALLEANRPFLRRRIERETTAFLRRMAERGLIDREAGFSVECSRSGEGGDGGRIRVEVKARLGA